MDDVLATVKRDLAQQVLDAYRAEHDALSETWRALEGKGQVSVGVAGIFLAALFTYVSAVVSGSVSDSLTRCALALIAVVLVASVIAALGALVLRRLPAPPHGGEFAKLAKDLLALEDKSELDQRMTNLIYDQATQWQSVSRTLAEANSWKACCVLSSQVLLAVAAIGITALTWHLL